MGDPQAQATQTPPAQAPDSAEQILRSTQGLDDNVRADAWDAYHNSANEDELAGKLQNMNLPQDVKANLWDAKHSAHPPQAQPQQVPGGKASPIAQAVGDVYGGMWGSLAQRLLGWAEGPPPAANAAPQAGSTTSTGYTPHVGDYVSPAYHREHPNEKPPVINIMTAGQKPGTITVHNPITQQPGETYADTVRRAVDAAKHATPEQVDEEKEENLLNAPATLATAYTLGRLGPVIYGGAKGMSVLKQAIAGGDSQVVGHPENMMTPDERKAHPYFSGLLEEAGNMSNPEMLSMLVGGGQLSKIGLKGMKLTSRLVAGGFSTTMVANAIKQVPDFIDVMKGTGKYADMDTDERESIAKNMVFHMTTNAAFATQAGEEALTGKTTPLVDTAPIKAGIKTAADLAQGKAANVVDATMRTLNIPERQRPKMREKVESVQNELENIFTKNKDTIEDPATFANAIEAHNRENEAAMQRAAGATRDSAEPVVPDFSQRVSARLDKLFADTKGQFSDADVVEAKKKILERILQSRNGQHMQEPNLFEAENVRKGLNDESQTAFDPITKKFAPKNAYQTAAFEAANAAREAIDQSYHTHGVENVQEFREKEAPLIDIVKGLRAMQGKAETKGQPGWFKALFNVAGATEGVGALATAILSGHPLAASIALPALLANRIHQNITNPIANIQRIGELANPNAQATEVNVRPTPPAGPTTPGAAPLPAPLPVVPNPTAPAPVATPVPTPAPPPEMNHELHRALATHYDELVGQSTYNELKGRFQAELEAKTRDGKRLDPGDPLKKLVDIHNKGITDITQKNIEAQRKQAEAEAKAAQVAQAEAEKEKEEKAASGQITTDHPPFATEDHLPLPKWAQDMGYTMPRVVLHELAHMLKIDDSGIQTGDIINHKHPKVDEGSLGEARWDKSEFSLEDGSIDPAKIPDVLDILHMGPVAEELAHGIPLHENPAEDLKVARKILTEAGIKPAEAGRMMKESEMRARAMLNEPGVMDVLKRYSEHREKGLDDELHMSSETVGRAMQEIRHARGKANEAGNEARPTEGNEKVDTEAGTGGEGAAKGEPKKEVQPTGTERAATGEGKPGKGTEPRTNLKPGAGTATADREENRGAGATTSHERTDFGGIVHLHEGDKLTGRLKYGLEGEKANLLGIEAPKGKGYGQKLLDEGMNQARERGAKTMEAGTKNTLSMDAAKMLDRAAERGVPVQKVEGKIPGSPAYQIDLTGGEGDEAGRMLAGETRHALPRNYKIMVEHLDQPQHEEDIPAYSRRDAIDKAIKKFPTYSQVSHTIEGEPEAKPQTYAVPKNKLAAMGQSYVNYEPTSRLKEPIETIRHELGHVFGAKRTVPGFPGYSFDSGLRPEEMYSRNHPNVRRIGGRAAVSTDVSALQDANGNFTKESIGDKLPHLLDNLMGGRAADELFNNINRKDNSGTQGDMSIGKRILQRHLGFTAEQADAMMDEATDRAKERLNHPVTRGIIEENAGYREPKLATTHLYSPERMQAMLAEHDRRMWEHEKQQGNVNPGGVPEIGQGHGDLATAAETRVGGATSQRVLSPEGIRAGRPTERTTGKLDDDTAIRAGGGVPGGAMFTGADQIRMFHDPESGTTLGFRAHEAITPEAVQAKLAASRAEYAAAERQNSGAKGEPIEWKTNLRPDRVSTRVPTAKATKTFTPEEHMGEEPLTIGREAVDKDPRIQQKLADVVKKYPGFKFPEGLKDPAKILDRFTTQVKDNLLHLWDSVAPEKRTANAKWYESVNKKANADAGEHGIQPRQAAGVYASLSPQKDWDMNASLAKRVMDTHFNHANDVGSPKMTDFGQGLVDKARADAENKMAAFKASGEKDPVIVQRKQGAYERKLKNAADLEAVVKKISGQKYSDLTDPYEKGVWVRLHDEVNNPRNYPKIDPGTGNPLEDVTNADGSKSKVAWGSMEPIARAVSILQDGSRENISEQLGGEHKVRNFYNNIIDPTHPEDVTIDTHAVAAGHMQPFSGQSKEVTNNFGSAGKSAQTGVHGSYPLYAEGYRQAAQARGVKAREMQSVTWEKIRELFPAEIKDADFQKQTQKIMKKVSDGKISIQEARKQVTNAAVDKRIGQMAGKVKQTLDNSPKVRDNISAGAAALGGE